MARPISGRKKRKFHRSRLMQSYQIDSSNVYSSTSSSEAEAVDAQPFLSAAHLMAMADPGSEDSDPDFLAPEQTMPCKKECSPFKLLCPSHSGEVHCASAVSLSVLVLLCKLVFSEPSVSQGIKSWQFRLVQNLCNVILDILQRHKSVTHIMSCFPVGWKTSTILVLLNELCKTLIITTMCVAAHCSQADIISTGVIDVLMKFAHIMQNSRRQMQFDDENSAVADFVQETEEDAATTDINLWSSNQESDSDAVINVMEMSEKDANQHFENVSSTCCDGNVEGQSETLDHEKEMDVTMTLQDNLRETTLDQIEAQVLWNAVTGLLALCKHVTSVSNQKLGQFEVVKAFLTSGGLALTCELIVQFDQLGQQGKFDFCSERQLREGLGNGQEDSRGMNNEEQIRRGVNKVDQLRFQSQVLLCAIAKLIQTVKQVKVYHIHNTSCTKRRHKKCNYKTYRDHHHEVCGSRNGEKYIVTGFQGCVIAELSRSLLYILHQAKQNFTRSRALHAFEVVGFCCCMTPADVIYPLLHELRVCETQIQPRITASLDVFLLQKLGGGEKVYPSCQICGEGHEIKETEMFDCNETDSAVSLSDTSAGPCFQKLPNSYLRWSGFVEYREMILESDTFAGLLLKHMFHLAVNGNKIVKYQLFSCVLLPILQSWMSTLSQKCTSQHNSGSQPEGKEPYTGTKFLVTAPIEVVKCCLGMLTLVISSPPVINTLLNCQGMCLLVKYLYMSDLRQSTLRVFRVLIKAQEESSDRITENTATEKLLSILWKNSHTQCLIRTFQATTDSSSEAIPALTDSSDENHELLYGDDHLNFVSDVWSSVMSLYQCCKAFRYVFLQQEGPSHAYHLLTHILQKLNDIAEGVACRSWAMEHHRCYRMVLNLIEHLFLICLHECCAVKVNNEVIMCY